MAKHRSESEFYIDCDGNHNFSCQNYDNLCIQPKQIFPSKDSAHE